MYVPPSSEQRHRVLAHVVADLRADTDVVGIYLAGSLAAGSADEQSDIDLRVVVAAAAAHRLRRERLARPATWPDFLFNEWDDDERCCVSHFAGFIKLDVVYVGSDEFAPSPWLTQPIRVLHDPQGLIAATIAQSAQRRTAPTPDDVEQAIGKMLAYAHEAVRRAARDELLYAQTMLDRLRTQMAALEDLCERRTPGLDAPSRLEARLSRSLVAALRDSCTTSERGELERAVRSLAPLCRALIERLHQRYALGASLDRQLRAIDALTGEPRG